ncbi:hypothetical protein LTS08_008578 [Lithohypha guttulata]|uniref:uncharacterized protein n=1 Tax=Lithohypha guttulata TaxID=1690604 RepID=UPI002DDF99DE|nr:hypothetical protein LTR51_002967 [Lithohypha guttulata]KAK5094526.1 hypothetical protein LTS08_008578 [Lithohypha guttulata]
MAAFEIHDEDLSSLRGQTILITGAASGIGLGTTKLLLEKGAYVVAGDMNELPIEHERLTSLRTDVTSWANLSALFKLAKSKHNKIDGVFANAGISGRTTYLDEKLDENGDLLEPTHLVLDINLKAVVNTVALAIHYMRRQDSGGSIVLTASASSFQRFRAVDYTTAKHGVLGLMRGLVPILQPDIPIRLNAIAPSWTTTGLVPEGFIEKVAGIGTQTPAVVARSVAILFADSRRNGQLIYSVEGKYSEAEGTLLKAAVDIVGEANEDMVMAKLLKAMSGFGVSAEKKEEDRAAS